VDRRVRTFTEQDNGSCVTLDIGESIELRLPENPTTGYRWHLADWDTSILEMTHDEYDQADSSRAGARGEHHWEFAGRRKGEVSLELSQRRSWGSAAPSATFTMQVSVV